MASHLPSTNPKSPAQSNPIKIVPIHEPAVTRAPASAPQLVYNDGPLLTAVKVFTVFWGSAWQQPPLSATAQGLNAFFNYILTSPLMDQLAEYSTPQQRIGYGSHVGTITLTTSDPAATLADSDIQQMLTDQIAANSAFPQPDANALYFVYLPGGVVVQQGGSSSCQAFCGYHDAFSAQSGQIYYGVIPYPDCSGCSVNLAVLDALTEVSSHELSEAITDPVPGQGWYDQNNGEIGDICAWQTKQVGNYLVQKEWSNNANACV
jgi:hypothetical protein